MLPNNTLKKNRVFAPVIIGITIFCMVFLLFPLYTSYVDTSIEVATLEKSKAEKQTKIDAIKKMQALFAASGSTELTNKVKKYNHSFNTSDIIETVMVNRFTAESKLNPPSINIGSINIDAGKKLPSGLSLANVSLSLSADSPDQIVDYLTYLTTDSPMAFTVDSINLPLDTASPGLNTTTVSLAISLGVYYYE